METIVGRLTRIKFQRDLWLVGELTVKDGDHRGLLTVTGTMPGIRLGDIVELFGEFEESKYGEQFKAKTATPRERSGVELFLQSLDNIGPVRAREIRELFGEEDVFRMIEQKPEELKKIAGLTDEKIGAIRQELLGRKLEISLYVKCQKLGLSPYIIGRIQQHFMEQGPVGVRGIAQKVSEYVLAAVEHEPYKLIEVEGIGFLTADKIAQKVGIKGDNPQRCFAAIDYVLQEIEESEGSSIINANMMLAALRGHDRGPHGEEPPVKLAPSIPDDVIYAVLGQMKDMGRVFLEGEYIQRKAAKECEESIAREIAMKFSGDYRAKEGLFSEMGSSS